MSMGYCAFCHKILEDEQTVLYEYTCYNIGEGNWEKAKETYDGSIMISKDAFVEPIIRQKCVKTSKGRKKLVTKRLHQEVNYSGLMKEERIKIKNCSGTWKMYDGIDVMARHLLGKIFDEYQDAGIVPEKVSFCS